MSALTNPVFQFKATVDDEDRKFVWSGPTQRVAQAELEDWMEKNYDDATIYRAEETKASKKRRGA